MIRTTAAAAAFLVLAGPALATHGDEAPPKCLPGYIDDEIPARTVQTLCDATAVNKKLRVKIDPDTGCAADGQKIRRGEIAGDVLEQVRYTEYVRPNARPAPLRACTEREVVRFPPGY